MNAICCFVDTRETDDGRLSALVRMGVAMVLVVVASSCSTSGTWQFSWGNEFDGQGCTRGRLEVNNAPSNNVPGGEKTVKNVTFTGGTGYQVRV